MAGGVAREGDGTSHGGVVHATQNNYFVNNLAVVRLGDPAPCPLPHHGGAVVTSASTSVTNGGAGVARIGDVTSCGAVITGGSSDTLAGD